MLGNHALADHRLDTVRVQAVFLLAHFLPQLAKLLKRVFDPDLEHCPNCGGELKIIAAILERPVIEKILTHLGLQARAPPRSPAREQALQAA
ncbi:MAG: hypothetical protein IPG91_13210 [Ideonella sp.]|nr:hypothetical protein [Ideonella sp.]